MKLDKDLMREVLLAVEDSTTPNEWVNIEVSGHSDVEISYQVELLAEAGFLDAIDLCHLGPDGYEWRARRLTYQGHEFLDTIRDPAVWKETKEIAKKLGTGSVTMLFEIAKVYVKQKLAGHGIALQ